jgi:hypothetical protein
MVFKDEEHNISALQVQAGLGGDDQRKADI